MKYIIVGFFLLPLMLLGNNNISNAQTQSSYEKNPPKLRDVRVYSDVTKEGKFYYYNYKIRNSSTSKDSIFVLEIDLFLQSSASEVDTTGLIFENNFIEGAFRRIYPALEGRIVPVGFPNAPARWGGTLSHSLRAGFSGFPKIAPGDSLNGYEMMSRGLPSIRKIIFKPSFNVDKYFPSLEDTTQTLSIVQMDSIRDSVNDTSFTIGPSLPPDPFQHLEFLDRVIGYIPQSQDLNWLGDASFATELEGQLQQVRSQLVAEDSAQAAATLSGFIGLVEAVNAGNGPAGATLTSEGYGLLYFNAQYLLERLPEPPAQSAIPELPAALSISSDQASGAFSEDNFLISGEDAVNGIFTTTEAARQGIVNGCKATSRITSPGRAAWTLTRLS